MATRGRGNATNLLCQHACSVSARQQLLRRDVEKILRISRDVMKNNANI
jgi:hypothetical protein